MAVISIKVAIAIGICSLFLLAISCFFCWGVKVLRHRTRATGQVAATLEEIPVEHRIGLEKEKVALSSIANPKDLNVQNGSKLQCPTCWLEFRDEDTLKQQPRNVHNLNRHCIDPVLDKQKTCPVCGIALTGNFITREKSNHRGPNHQVIPDRNICSNSLSTPKSSTTLPSWVHVNPPVPLPETAIVNSHPCAYDLEQCMDISLTFGTDIPVEKRQPSTSDRSVDSFSFGIPSTDSFTFPELGVAAQNSWDAAPTIVRSSLRRSRSKGSTIGDSSDSSNSNSRTRYSRSASMRFRMPNPLLDNSSFKRVAMEEGYEYPQFHERYEHVTLDHQLSTVPQDQQSSDVSFIFGPGDHTLRPSLDSKELLRAASSCNAYSQQIETSRSTRWERL